MPPSSTLAASWGVPACDTSRAKIYNAGHFWAPLRTAPSAGSVIGCRRHVECQHQQGRHHSTVCLASPGEDTSEDGWSLRPFWGVVTNRETERSLCCTDPNFIEKKERLQLPDVNWARYNQQVLFVDRTDVVRARVAAGLFDVISAWNCMDRMLIQDRCGTDAEASGYMDPGTAISLVALASDMDISRRSFTRQLQRFESDDLYRYDLIIALDSGVKDALLEAAVAESGTVFTESYLSWFRSKVALLSDFSAWCDDVHVCRQGGSALLPRTLARRIEPVIGEARKVVDIPRPDLNSPEGEEQWQAMAFSVLLGTAGLTQYLIDSCPEDLPNWETLGEPPRNLD